MASFRSDLATMNDRQYRGPRLNPTSLAGSVRSTSGAQVYNGTRYPVQQGRVRPFPARTAEYLASRNMFFGLCARDSRCRGAKECTYAHSVEEKKAWNIKLANWPRRVPSQPTQPTADGLYPQYLSSAQNQLLDPSVS